MGHLSTQNSEKSRQFFLLLNILHAAVQLAYNCRYMCLSLCPSLAVLELQATSTLLNIVGERKLVSDEHQSLEQ